MLKRGQIVETGEGNTGRVATSIDGPRYETWSAGSGRRYRVFTVVLDNGKVERWAEHALKEVSDGGIKRSGSLSH